MSQPSKGRNAVWTDEMVKCLLWAIPWGSAREVAEHLNNKYGTNLTRNSILGKLYRVKQTRGEK